ncbi:MAG: hypothetical protein LBG47_05335 [Prevotellaceae bacterium]|jgi:uncharacterized membrane protein|nr:hypothetical protein [Prevotellaceae bacterium]
MKTSKEYPVLSRKLSTASELVAILFGISSTSGLIQAGGILFKNDAKNFVIFAILCAAIAILLYVIFRRIVASIQERAGTLVKFFCVLVMVTLNFGVIYLYSYQMLTSKHLLYAMLPVSAIITFTCLLMWVRFPLKR